MKAEWARGLQKMAQLYNVAFFFKQWGGTNKKKAGRILDGKEWNAMPQSKSFCNL
jgi:protein gp37